MSAPSVSFKKALQPDADKMAAGDLTTLIQSARRMKMALQTHVQLLEEEAAARAEAGKRIPSRDNFFIYATDPTKAKADGEFEFTSLITIQQDAAFFVEGMVLANPQSVDVIGVCFYEVAIQDANAGRDLTLSQHPELPDGTDLLDPTVNVSTLCPWELFYPTAGTEWDRRVAPNVDYWNPLSVDHILPRGSVWRVTIRSVGSLAVTADDPPQLLLLGYKVF